MYPCNPLLQITDLKKSLLELRKNKKINLFFQFQVFQNHMNNLIVLNKSNNVKYVKNYLKKNIILIQVNFI